MPDEEAGETEGASASLWPKSKGVSLVWRGNQNTAWTTYSMAQRDEKPASSSGLEGINRRE